MSYWLCPWVVAQSRTSETSETIYESTKSNIPEDSNLEKKSVVGTLNLGTVQSQVHSVSSNNKGDRLRRLRTELHSINRTPNTISDFVTN